MSQYGERYYNEVVLSAPAVVSALPYSIDAVFFIDGVLEDRCVGDVGHII